MLARRRLLSSLPLPFSVRRACNFRTVCRSLLGDECKLGAATVAASRWLLRNSYFEETLSAQI